MVYTLLIICWLAWALLGTDLRRVEPIHRFVHDLADVCTRDSSVFYHISAGWAVLACLTVGVVLIHYVMWRISRGENHPQG